MTVRLGLSFDLLGTLLELHHSPGYQYRLEICRFLQRKGLHSPPINEVVLGKNFNSGFATELERDRAIWVEKRLGDPKEMPIGGMTKESTLDFWRRVIEAVYDLDGLFCDRDEAVMSVLQEAHRNREWDDFIKGVVQRFSTSEPYVWLPEALPTLRRLQEWRETEIPPGIECAPPTLVSNSDARLTSALREKLLAEGGAPLLGQLFSADMLGKSKPSPLGIQRAAEACGVTSMRRWIHVGDAEEDRMAAERSGCHFVRCSPKKGPVWCEIRARLDEVLANMIRRSLDVVPTVIPRHRLEEDARLAAKKKQQQVEETQQQVNRYRIVRCDKVAAAEGTDERDDTSGLRLFSLFPSPELGSRIPKSLKVLEAPKKTWKHVRRTVYSGLMCRLATEGSSAEINGVQGEEDDCEDESGDEPRFTSLPIPEYENMACLLLTLPSSDSRDAVAAKVRLLDTPLHILHYERAEAVKEGQGISTSWHSGMDMLSVGFKRSYIDDDDVEEEDRYRNVDKSRGFSNHAAPENQKNNAKRDTKVVARAAKKSRLDSNNNDQLIETDAEVTAVKAQGDNNHVLQNKEVSVSVLPSSLSSSSSPSAAPVTGEGSKTAPELDFSGVDTWDLQSLTASLLQQWAAAGKVVTPLTGVVKLVLKSHPSYAEMKVKHLSPNSRQEAVDWFRVSQSAVRGHVLHLGYTIDSTNNVYLSQNRKN